MLLIERGRLAVEGEADEWLTERLRATPAREAALTHEVAIRSRTVRLAHPDPTDRFLVATAAVHELTLVSADERLRACRDAETLPNR